MDTKYFSLLLVMSTILAACSFAPPIRQNLEAHGHYWQRTIVTESSYMNGPKAQEKLERDIAHCVTELRELDRLGTLRHAIPADSNGNMHHPELADWESPTREGALLAEHTDYHDFEGCMTAGGWERMEYIPYDTANKARNDYINIKTGRPVGIPFEKKSHEQRDWDGINN